MALTQAGKCSKKHLELINQMNRELMELGQKDGQKTLGTVGGGASFVRIGN